VTTADIVCPLAALLLVSLDTFPFASYPTVSPISVVEPFTAVRPFIRSRPSKSVDSITPFLKLIVFRAPLGQYAISAFTQSFPA